MPITWAHFNFTAVPPFGKFLALCQFFTVRWQNVFYKNLLIHLFWFFHPDFVDYSVEYQHDLTFFSNHSKTKKPSINSPSIWPLSSPYDTAFISIAIKYFAFNSPIHTVWKFQKFTLAIFFTKLREIILSSASLE